MSAIIDEQGFFRIVPRISVTSMDKVLRCRWTWTTKDSGVLKSRLFIKENDEDDLFKVYVASPTVRKSSVRLAIFLASALGLNLYADS